MIFTRQSPPAILLLILNYVYFSTILAAELTRLPVWEDLSSEPIDRNRYSVESVVVGAFRRRVDKCTYTVTLRSTLLPTELIVLCARTRRSLPCLINNGVETCEIYPMELSRFELFLLDVINRELQMRVYRIYQQQSMGQKVSLEAWDEIQQILSDDLYWLCSRKCSNSTCTFEAELKPQRRIMGDVPRLTSLITSYPKPRRGRRLIEIYFPIGSDEIFHLFLQKNAHLRYLAVSSLPLNVSCQRN